MTAYPERSRTRSRGKYRDMNHDRTTGRACYRVRDRDRVGERSADRNLNLKRRANDSSNEYVKKRRFSRKDNELSNNNNYYQHQNNNFYFQNNTNNYHQHQHHHNHNHAHHHYHHHHHYNNNHNRDREREQRERDREKDIETKKDIQNKDSKKTVINAADPDLEGIVNLNGISSIYRSRYLIFDKLGQGTFGSVIECYDNKRDLHVAVKIVRSVRRYLDAASIEVDILNKLDELDIYRNSLIIRLYKSFNCYINKLEHSCLVFEKCGYSLYDYIKKNKYLGFKLSHIAQIGFQLFHTINFCHLNLLTHTDLKLENILFIDSKIREMNLNKNKKYYLPNSFEIRLIDFGGATFESDHHSSIINTRQYRGPEVILGSPKWSYPSDIWSLGCILCELLTGELLFGTHQNEEHLHLIKKILSIKEYPKYMMQSKNAQSLLNINNLNKKSIKYIEKNKKLSQIINDELLYDLIKKCLECDPNKRITANQAKKHPFFKQYVNSKNNDGFMKIYNKCSKGQI